MTTTIVLPLLRRRLPCKRGRHRCLAALARQPAAGPVAQWLEPAAHNGLVAGSSPAGPTNVFNSSEGCDIAAESLWLSQAKSSLTVARLLSCDGTQSWRPA